MRPTKSTDTTGLYECFGCGERAREPESRVCEHCGGHLGNIGRARDL